MPLVIRNKIHLQNVATLTFDANNSVSRDLSIPYQDFFIAACPVSGLSASVAMYSIGAGTSPSLQTLRFTGTTCTCPISIVKPVPQDAALSGSGTVYVDCSDITANGAAVAIGASLYLVPNGSAIGDSGTSTLGAAASGTTITLSSASELNSGSLFQFNAPKTRSGFFALKLVVDSVDAGNTSGSNFALFGVRLRYKADRLGT